MLGSQVLSFGFWLFTSETKVGGSTGMSRRASGATVWCAWKAGDLYFAEEFPYIACIAGHEDSDAEEVFLEEEETPDPGMPDVLDGLAPLSVCVRV